MTGQVTGMGECPPSEDQALLSDLERWRSAIGRNVALRNPSLTSGELNRFVHGILDRILYLRICEDRGLLPKGTLRDLAPADGVLERVSALFLDAGTDSPLALFSCTGEGERAPCSPHARELQLDDRVLRGFVEGFSSPGIPCDFSVLPTLRLAEVFRVFLRREIRLEGGHRAVVEERAEAKGAGGFFPPPETAREYLVAHTLAALVNGGTPDGLSRLRVLDPACGSGLLLLRSHRFLQNWHRHWYQEEGGGGGISPRGLTPEERFRILGSLFGVDPDPRAVEVTRLLLLVMALEGEQGPGPLTSCHDLPALCRVLGRNILCGNALIGPEYLEKTFPRPSHHRARQLGNPVDWEEVFSEVRESGGFDAVMVEPPTHHPGTEKSLREYLRQHFRAYHDDADMAVYLMERGISRVRTGGVFASLTPDRWLRARYGGPLRRLLCTFQMEEIVLLAGPSGPESTTGGAGHCILRASHLPPSHGVRVLRMDPVAMAGMAASRPPRSRTVNPATLGDRGWTFEDGDSAGLRDRLYRACTPLERYLVGTLTRGDPTPRAERALVDRATRDRLIREGPGTSLQFRPVVVAEQISRYLPTEPAGYLPVKPGPGSPVAGTGAREAPATAMGMILCVESDRVPVCTLDTSDALADGRVLVIPRRDHYLLALLNSSLARFLFREQGGREQPGIGLALQSLERFPVYIPDFSDPADTARHDRMVALVTQMLDLHRKLQESTLEHEKNVIQRQIEATDREIDDLVYELYGLTEEERRIVEEATQP